MPKSSRLVLAAVAVAALPSMALAQGAPLYHLTASAALGGPDRWDYVVLDAPASRVYVAHSDHVDVVDSRTAKLVGSVTGIPGGTHGIAISHAADLGFTDDGKAGEAVAFDLKTLKIVKKMKAAPDADAIAFDKASGHVFVIEGDPSTVQIIDPKKDAITATIAVGGNLEYAVADGRGHLFVNGALKREIVRINLKTNKVDAHWPIPDCAIPHGLAIDPATHRLYSGCVNSKMMVVNSETGALVTSLPIGRGSDAIAFDETRKRVFSSNGIDGTLTVIHEDGPDSYSIIATVPTQLSGRTMAVDPATGRIYIAAAAFDPNPTPGARPILRPSSLQLLMFDPAD